MRVFRSQCEEIAKGFITRGISWEDLSTLEMLPYGNGLKARISKDMHNHEYGVAPSGRIAYMLSSRPPPSTDAIIKSREDEDYYTTFRTQPPPAQPPPAKPLPPPPSIDAIIESREDEGYYTTFLR